MSTSAKIIQKRVRSNYDSKMLRKLVATMRMQNRLLRQVISDQQKLIPKKFSAGSIGTAHRSV